MRNTASALRSRTGGIGVFTNIELKADRLYEEVSLLVKTPIPYVMDEQKESHANKAPNLFFILQQQFECWLLRKGYKQTALKIIHKQPDALYLV